MNHNISIEVRTHNLHLLYTTHYSGMVALNCLIPICCTRNIHDRRVFDTLPLFSAQSLFQRKESIVYVFLINTYSLRLT